MVQSTTTNRSLTKIGSGTLVLKFDNGSPFIAEDLQVWLAQTDIFPLFSPVRTPQYNGGCEAGNGSLERRTEELAARAGRPALWTCDDAEGARRMANEVNYPWGAHGPTPAELWRARTPLSAERRTAFAAALEEQRRRARGELECPQTGPLPPLDQRAVDRVAIRRALVEHGLLTFTRRQFTPPIQSEKVSNIT